MQDPKGYDVNGGYMGFVESEKKYILFSNESDYLDFISAEDEDEEDDFRKEDEELV